MKTTQSPKKQTSPAPVEADGKPQELESIEKPEPTGLDSSNQSGNVPAPSNSSETGDESLKATRLLSYVDAATMLALSTAALFYWGYSYFSAYYASLGVPFGFLSLPVEAYLATGWNYGWVLLFFAAYVLFLRAFFNDVVRWILNKIPDEYKRIIAGYLPAFLLAIPLVIFLFVGYTARQDAQSRAAAAFDRRKKVEFITAEGITLPKPLYLLGYTGNKYIVYYQPNEKAKPRIYILGEAEVRAPSFPGADDNSASSSAAPDIQEKADKEGSLSRSQREALGRVAAGERLFKPAMDGDMTDASDAFQPLAENLIELGENGLLMGVQASRESRTGKHNIETVSIEGLSAKGRRALKHDQSVNSEQSK